jgi:hypothetical protein
MRSDCRAGWRFSLDATSAVDITYDQFEELVGCFRAYDGALATAPGRIGVTFSLHTSDILNTSASLEQVAGAGVQLFREILSEVGLDDWTLVRLDVCTFAEYDNDLTPRT